MNSKPLDRELLSWLDGQLEDSFDEEYEMEIDDLRRLKEVEALTDLKPQSALDRPTYLRELLRLQAELVKLQDWVVHAGYKLVVIFEGRDATGKGGSIKQVTQRLIRASAERRRCRRLPTGKDAMVFSTLCTAFTRCR